jgi:hypothetical protein
VAKQTNEVVELAARLGMDLTVASNENWTRFFGDTLARPKYKALRRKIAAEVGQLMLAHYRSKQGPLKCGCCGQTIAKGKH